MISWVVACHEPDRPVFEANLLATLDLPDGDELVVVENAGSITLAYAQGQAKASQPVRCYVHSDVQILDLPRLRDELLARTAGHGMVGVIGSRDAVMPWWDGRCLGSVVDTRMGLIDFGAGGECAMLDGLLLATRQTVQWDIDAPGWHGYDNDSCAQMLARGLTNFTITGGHRLVVHNAARKDRTAGWAEAVQRFRARWSHLPAPQPVG